MKKRTLADAFPLPRLLAFLAALLLLAGCGAKTVTVQIPPRVDLKTWPLVGLIEFTSPDHPELSAPMTRQFRVDTLSSQPGVRILELGRLPDLLAQAHASRLDPAAVKAIGSRYGVAALLSGTLAVTPETPNLDFAGDLRSLKARVEVRGELMAKLQETATGATVWDNGAHGTWTLARMDLGINGLSNLKLTAAEARYNQMLRDLSGVATRDFRPRYVRRRIQPAE